MMRMITTKKRTKIKVKARSRINSWRKRLKRIKMIPQIKVTKIK